jgi:sulfate transport system permease protein
MATTTQRVMPGFGLCLGCSVSYLTVLVLIPLGACFLKASSLSFSEFCAVVWTERARSAYALTFGAALVSSLINAVLGLNVAWVLARYDFPGKRLVDAIVDLPFALPTAVAGLVFSSLYVPNGWLGQFLSPLGIDAAYSRLGIVLVLTFTSFPFVVRTVLVLLGISFAVLVAINLLERWSKRHAG